LLDHAAAAASDFRVLRGVGIEGESELAYAALHQILRPVFNRIDHLPEPQAASLRGAFALSSETVGERFRVSLGVLGLVSEVAEERPLLCLVDDAQWIDQASADALLFAARRVQAEHLVLLFAARDDEERPFVAHGVPELRVPPLSAADARELLSASLGSALAAGVFDWLVENAGGNPLALMELPATLTAHELAGQDPLVGRLAPATSVEQAYMERVKALPIPARTLLVLAAAEGTGARATVERACAGLQLDIGELTAAESAGLVRVDAEQVVFRHPLVRSAVYRGAAFTEREQAHRLLAVAAAAEGNADRAAWHRAAATVGTDDDVARELESTAERAQLRSGHAAAAAALERAAELSSDNESKARRFVLAARAAWNAGQPEHSAALLDRADPILTDRRRRADVDHLRGVIEWRCGSLPEAAATLIAGAARIAPVDARKALLMLSDGGMAAWDAGDYARLGEVGEATAALPRSFESTCDDVGAEEFGLLADVLAGCVALSLGQTVVKEGLVDAVSRARDCHEPRLLLWGAIAAEVAGEEEVEAALLRRAGTLARSSGAVDRLTVVLEAVGVQGFLAGHFTLAAEAAGEGLTLARETGTPNAANLHLASLAWLAAVQGREDECRLHAGKVVDAARPTGDGIANSIAEWALALLDLAIGRPEETVARLLALSSAPPGVGHPFYVLNSAPDLVEACVRTGRHDAARAAFTVLQDFARPGAPQWSLALAARCRALLGEGAGAEAEFAKAMELHAQISNAFDRARTELLYGEFLRRERRRTDAREQLRAAVEAFEQLRAEPWAERARAELRATGETARKRDPSTLADLTPQELQIARLVGEGHSNKDVAAQLFLSPRTVEYHLRKVFSKLGITSRAELIRHGVHADGGRELAAAAS
jgi:DNA-binding CsgD family transcriptional regulator